MLTREAWNCNCHMARILHGLCLIWNQIFKDCNWVLPPSLLACIQELFGLFKCLLSQLGRFMNILTVHCCLGFVEALWNILLSHSIETLSHIKSVLAYLLIDPQVIARQEQVRQVLRVAKLVDSHQIWAWIWGDLLECLVQTGSLRSFRDSQSWETEVASGCHDALCSRQVKADQSLLQLLFVHLSLDLRSQGFKLFSDLPHFEVPENFLIEVNGPVEEVLSPRLSFANLRKENQWINPHPTKGIKRGCRAGKIRQEQEPIKFADDELEVSAWEQSLRVVHEFVVGLFDKSRKLFIQLVTLSVPLFEDLLEHFIQ